MVYVMNNTTPSRALASQCDAARCDFPVSVRVQAWSKSNRIVDESDVCIEHTEWARDLFYERVHPSSGRVFRPRVTVTRYQSAQTPHDPRLCAECAEREYR